MTNGLTQEFNFLLWDKQEDLCVTFNKYLDKAILYKKIFVGDLQDEIQRDSTTSKSLVSCQLIHRTCSDREY